MKRGFTLIEVLVTIVLVSIAVVGVMSGIRSIQASSARARTADLLQRLVSEKVGDLRLYSDPATSGTSGNFSDRGHPEITWTAAVTTASAADTDQITVTATRGRSTQAVSTLMFVRPSAGAAP